MPLSNVLIIKVLIVPVIHLFYYFSTAVTSILNCMFSIFCSICVIFVFCLCFCAGCIKVLVLLYMHLNKYLMNWYFLSNNIRNSNIILISLLCYVSSSKNIRRKSLRRYMYIYIYTHTHKTISCVEFLLDVFELGHCNVLIFWSRLSAFCASHYLSAYQCHNFRYVYIK